MLKAINKIEMQKLDPADNCCLLENYYLSYLAYKNQGDPESANLFLSRIPLSATGALNSKFLNEDREIGTKLKNQGELAKAKEYFSRAASADDPISQYELAILSGTNSVSAQGKKMLERASQKLLPARITLYRLLLEQQAYDEANSLFIYIINLVKDVQATHNLVKWQILAVPCLPHDVVSYFKQPADYFSRDSLALKITTNSAKTLLHEVLYKLSLVAQGNERIHLLNLAALNGSAKAIVALYAINTEGKEREHRAHMNEMILRSNYGDSSITTQLIELAKKGDINVLGVLVEKSLVDIKNTHYIELLKAAAICKESSPLAKCALGYIIFRHGKSLVDINLGVDSLTSKDLRAEVEQLASVGDVLAHFYMGIIGKVNKEYTTTLKWLIKSSINHLPALHELGALCQTGLSTGRALALSVCDLSSAEICYRKCAELGCARSQHALGTIAFKKKDLTQTLDWLEKSVAQGYEESIDYLKRVIKSNYEQELKDWAATAIVALEKILSDRNEQENQGEVKEITQNVNNLLLEEDIIQTVDNPPQQIPLAQQNVLQNEEEEKKIGQDGESNSSSHHKQILSLTGIIYDNPQAVAEAQISSLMNFVGKNVAIPKIQTGPQNHGKEAYIFNEELRSFLPMKQLSLVDNAPMVSLTQAAFLDKKLVTQAEYFAQTGVAFATLQDAAGVGTVHMMGGLPPTEEESIIDPALDWMGLSRLSEDFLEDFSHLL